jgi:hypothetical protein
MITIINEDDDFKSLNTHDCYEVDIIFRLENIIVHEKD